VQQQQEQPREEQRHEQPHEQPQQHGQQLQPERERPEPPPIPKTHTVVTVSNKTGVPASVELLRDEVREMGEDADAIFQLITERAAIVTGAGGAALALLTGDRMIWRARSGDPAPPRGAPVDIKQGLSAECVRTGLLVSSQDLGNDSRVDPKIGRAVGIGSLIAAPIVSDFRVVGLLEVFSPYPRSFTRAHGKILERLVEVIPQAHRGVAAGQSDASFRLQSASNGIFPAADPWAANNEFDERAWHRSELAVSEQLLAPASKASGGASRFFHLGLLGLAIMVVFVVLGYMVGPLIEKHWAASSSVPESLIKGAQAAGAVLVPASVRPLPAKSLEELERLANRGDADAQWQMAVRYHDGEGVPQSDTQAMLWFQLAAEQGNVAAQSALGSYYWAGRGVPEDLSKAYMWSAIALAGGDANSKTRLEGLASRMTHAQVSSARQLAEVWLRSHRQRSKSEAN
jgi:hypothetical protein